MNSKNVLEHKPRWDFFFLLRYILLKITGACCFSCIWGTAEVQSIWALLLQPGYCLAVENGLWQMGYCFCFFFFAVIWKETPCWMLILMTQLKGICCFSTNSNYNTEELSQFVCLMPTLQKTKDPRTGHSAASSWVSFSRSFPCMTSPAPDSSHCVLPKNSSIPQSETRSLFFPQPFQEVSFF